MASYFNVDVTLVRIGFVVATVLTGVGVVAYPLAWLLIPKAKVWPQPASATRREFSRGRNWSKRDMGLVALAIGMLALFATGGPGEVLAPLALVGGGLWLLSQPPAVAVAAGGGMASSGAAPPPPTGASSRFDYEPIAPWETPPTPPQGIARPTGRRRLARGLVRTALVGVPLLLIGGGVIALVASEGDLSFGNMELLSDGEGDLTLIPSSYGELPPDINRDFGSVKIDLSRLPSLSPVSADGLEASLVPEAPQVLAVNVDAGDIHVCTGGLETAGEASATFGDIALFHSLYDGVNSDASWTSERADIFLDLDVDFGSIRVTETC